MNNLILLLLLEPKTANGGKQPRKQKDPKLHKSPLDTQPTAKLSINDRPIIFTITTVAPTKNATRDSQKVKRVTITSSYNRTRRSRITQ